MICCSYVNSGSNLVLLCWSCVLARHAYTNTELCNDAQWIRLVEVQCLALHGVLSAGTACICQAARKKLHRVWKEVWHKLLLLYYCSFYDFSFLRDFSFLCCSVTCKCYECTYMDVRWGTYILTSWKFLPQASSPPFML